MAIQTSAMKNIVTDAYKAAALYGTVYTTAPGGSAGTEPTGGSPTFARKSLSWGSSSGGVVSTSGTVFDIPASTTIVGVGVHSAVSAGTYYDGAAVTSQTFASQGTYSVTFTFTET